MGIAQSFGAASKLLREHRAVHGQHGQFAEDRGAPDARPEVPAIIAEEQSIDGYHAAYGIGVLDRPGEGERAAEIMRDEIDRPCDIGGGKELFDEMRQAIERALKMRGHLRMTEAGQIGGDAAIVRRHAIGDAFPHDAAIRIAVKQQNRRSGAPFGHADIRIADPNRACRCACAIAMGHRPPPARHGTSIGAPA
jgi:hypothetical protein